MTYFHPGMMQNERELVLKLRSYVFPHNSDYFGGCIYMRLKAQKVNEMKLPQN